MLFLLYTVHVVVCIFLILVVLLQQGKGADLSVFGGGGTMTAFGARGAATLLHKMTVLSFVLFVVTTVGIGIAQGFAAKSTVMSAVAADDETAVEAPAVDETATEAADTPQSEAPPVEDAATATDGTGDDAATADGSGDSAAEPAVDGGDDTGGGQ